MKRCSKEAYALCSCPCCSIAEATYLEGSACDMFNQAVAKGSCCANNPSKYLYDYEIAETMSELQTVLRKINLNDYALIAATQSAGVYTVFFRRPAHG